MSSWKPYVDLILKDPLIKAAALAGRDGSIWYDAGVGLTATEIPALVRGCDLVSQFQADGIIAGGVKYMYVTSTEHLVIGPIRVGRARVTTIMIARTIKALEIALLEDGANPANVTQLQVVAADLRTKGF